MIRISLFFASLLGLQTAIAESAANPNTLVAAVPENATTSPIAAEPEMDFVVKSAITRRDFVEEAPELPGLPPVRGAISVTIKRVEAPNLPDPPQPPPPVDRNDPAVMARLAELRGKYKAVQHVFVSAHVYDHNRTLVRWHPSGQPGEEMTAWSNLNFNHFSGCSTYQLTDAGGNSTTYSLIMGVGNYSTEAMKRIAARQGRSYVPPAIPDLPPLSEGPAFVVVEGGSSSREAMRIVEGLHEHYRVEGPRMEQAYKDRVKAEADRRAYLVANPPQPKDVTIHYWKRARPAAVQTPSRERPGE
jgi:hypothetical protein